MLQIKDLFQLEKLNKLTFYAGQKGQDHEITSVTVMDIPEINNWLDEGELVLAGVLFQQCFSRELIDSFLQKNIAGIVTKQKFLTSIPTELFDYCNEIGFPILLAPADYNWGEIMNTVVSFMIRKPYLIIEQNQKFHYSLMESMIQGTSLTEICNELYRSNQLTLAIADSDLHLIGFSEHFDWKKYTRKLSINTLQYSGNSMDNLDNKKMFIYTYTTPLLSSLGIRLLLFPILKNKISYGYILLLNNTESPTPDESVILKIQQLSMVVALHFSQQNEITTAMRRFNSLIFEKLMDTEHLTHFDAVHLLAPLEKKIHRTYYVLYFQPDSTSMINNSSSILHNNRVGRFYSMVQNTLNYSSHILLFEKNEAQIILLPSPYETLENDILKIRELYINTLKPTNVSLGLSQPMDLCNLSEAFQQARIAASFHCSSRKELPYMEYQKLGIIRYFINNAGELDYNFLNEIIEKCITPLEEYDKEHHTELLLTLQLYLTNNGSKIKTEQQLFIHKNTLRARLSTINKILNRDVDLLEDLFEIQLAFKLHQWLNI